MLLGLTNDSGRELLIDTFDAASDFALLYTSAPSSNFIQISTLDTITGREIVAKGFSQSDNARTTVTFENGRVVETDVQLSEMRGLVEVSFTFPDNYLAKNGGNTALVELAGKTAYYFQGPSTPGFSGAAVSVDGSGLVGIFVGPAAGFHLPAITVLDVRQLLKGCLNENH